MTPELSFFAALAAGFFGSAHCLGMCGAIVVLFEGPAGDASVGRAWQQRIAYNLGRLGFYGLLGGVAGAGGAIITRFAGVAETLLAFRVLAAALVLAIGLNLLFGWRLTRFLESAGAGLWRRLSRPARAVLPVRSTAQAVLAGFFWGALPCGLVYSIVALAATTGSIVSGALVMAAFWLGTLPALLAVGTSALHVNRWKNHNSLRRAAGIIIILVGLAALTPIAAVSTDGRHHSANALHSIHQETPICCHAATI